MFSALTYKSTLLSTSSFDMDMTFFTEVELLREEEKFYQNVYATTMKSKTYYTKKLNHLQGYTAFENIRDPIEVNEAALEGLMDILKKWKEKFKNHLMKYKKWYKFILTMMTMGISIYFTWGPPIISKAFAMGMAKSTVISYPFNKVLKGLSVSGGAPTAIREIVNVPLPKAEEGLDKYKTTIDKIVDRRFPMSNEEEPATPKPSKKDTVGSLGYTSGNAMQLFNATKKATQDFKNCEFADKELDRLMNSKEAQTSYGREAVNYAAKNVSEIMKKFGQNLKESHTTIKQLDGNVKKYAKVKDKDEEKEEA